MLMNVLHNVDRLLLFFVLSSICRGIFHAHISKTGIYAILRIQFPGQA